MMIPVKKLCDLLTLLTTLSMRNRISTWPCYLCAWVWLIGVSNTSFVALVATVVRFQAKPSQFFFAIFDSLVAITTHPGAQNSRSGSFGADNAGQTIALPRFAHARGVINTYATCMHNDPLPFAI